MQECSKIVTVIEYDGAVGLVCDELGNEYYFLAYHLNIEPGDKVKIRPENNRAFFVEPLKDNKVKIHPENNRAFFAESLKDNKVKVKE